MAAPATADHNPVHPDQHRPHALVHLITGRRLYTTCACRQEIQAANARLHHQALPLRYLPQPLLIPPA